MHSSWFNRFTEFPESRKNNIEDQQCAFVGAGVSCFGSDSKFVILSG